MRTFLNRYIVLISIVFLLVFLFTLNYLLPPQSDDLHIVVRDAGMTALERMKNIYMGWNGRFGELLYVGLINPINDYRFDILNAIVGICFIILVFFHAFGRFPKDRFDSFMLVFILFCFMYFSSFGSDFLWTAGSMNYLWSGTLILLSFVPYHRFLRAKFSGGEYHLKPIFIPIFLLISLFAGWSSEAMAAVSIITHIALLCILFIKKIKIPKWYMLGIILFIVGFCLLYFSPGINHRSGSAREFLSLGDLLTLPINNLLARIHLIFKMAYSPSFLVFYNAILIIFCAKFIYKMPSNLIKILFIISLGILSLCMNEYVFVAYIGTFIALVILLKYHKEPLFIALFIIFIIHTLLVLVPIQITYIPPRARLGEHGILIAGFCLLFRHYLEHIKYITPLTLIICLIYGAFVWSEYYSYNARLKDMRAYIKEQKELGKIDIIYDNIFISHYKNFNDWLIPTEIWVENENRIYARYYKLKTFKIRDGDKATWKF